MSAASTAFRVGIARKEVSSGRCRSLLRSGQSHVPVDGPDGELLGRATPTNQKSADAKQKTLAGLDPIGVPIRAEHYDGLTLVPH